MAELPSASRKSFESGESYVYNEAEYMVTNSIQSVNAKLWNKCTNRETILCNSDSRDMVSINQSTLHRGASKLASNRLFLLFGSLVVVAIVWGVAGSNASSNSTEALEPTPKAAVGSPQLRSDRETDPAKPHVVKVEFDESKWEKKPVGMSAKCSYQRLDQLSEDEVYPKAGERHMITPPSGGKLSLVCCATTAGPLNIMVHHKWAPNGAGRFVDMVTSGYFNSGVPFMRCVENFLCQFGLNADASKRKDFRESLPDDPYWLPKGPKNRENDAGVKRFARGYLAYAGSGENSRDKQLIMALEPNGPLSGGSPWEVPWGELVHPESFETLGKIYTGYGENGPPQGQLGTNGMTAEMRQKWPKLDYINSCQLLDELVLVELPDEPVE